MDMSTIWVLVGIAVFVLVVAFGKKQTNVQSATEDDITEALNTDNKVLAIKYYRSVHGVGLTEAKRAIDELAKAK